MTPKQYLQATRLGCVRKELCRNGSAVKITEVAAEWGFWHMGKFAHFFNWNLKSVPCSLLKSE